MKNNDARIDLHPAVAALAKGFKLVAGRLAMSDAEIISHGQTIAALPSKECEDATRDVLALAAKFNRLAPDDTVDARVQLVALAAALETKARLASAGAKAGVSDKAERVAKKHAALSSKLKTSPTAAGSKRLADGIAPRKGKTKR